MFFLFVQRTQTVCRFTACVCVSFTQNGEQFLKNFSQFDSFNIVFSPAILVLFGQ